MKRKHAKVFPVNFGELEQYFKIGESYDYILMREDCPVGDIPPHLFKSLVLEMFRRNDEVLSHEK